MKYNMQFPKRNKVFTLRVPDTKSSFNLSLPNRPRQGHFKALSSLLHVEVQIEGNLALDAGIWIFNSECM